jgi:hypothetical protein
MLSDAWKKLYEAYNVRDQQHAMTSLFSIEIRDILQQRCDDLRVARLVAQVDDAREQFDGSFVLRLTVSGVESTDTSMDLA